MLRLAVTDDIPALRALIEASVRGLQGADYTAAQIDGALSTVYGVDSQLIADGTYYVVTDADAVVACGGWSQHGTLFGGDQYQTQYEGRTDAWLDPTRDAAKIRAFFVDPGYARQGIGTMILGACEAAAAGAGFRAMEMGATLTGVPFYLARGYATGESMTVPLANGASLAIVRMTRRLTND
jgi:GNAT superfamily N-acetyltransferase